MTAVVANVVQEEVWNGEEGRRWTDNHRRLDRMAAPAGELLFAAARIGENDRVLDIGCGTGETTRMAARLATGGHAVGIDLSVRMLELARSVAAAEAIGNITFERGDAQVHPLPSGHFDVAISRAGVMFFEDPVAAFANIRRSLRPEGRLAFLCHRGDNGKTDGIFTALTHHLRALDPGHRTQGVADFTDKGYVGDVLHRAGFTEIAISPVDYTTVLGQDVSDAADFLIGVQLAGYVAGADEAAQGRLRADLESALRPHVDGGAVRLPAAAWIVTAGPGEVTWTGRGD